MTESEQNSTSKPGSSTLGQGTCSWATGKKRDLAAEGQAVINLLQGKLGQHISSCELSLGDAVAQIQRTGALDFFKILKLDSDFAFDFLVSLTAVDWLDQKPERYTVVYHLLSMSHGYRLRVKIPVPESDAEIDSVVELWSAANFMERECWDMYGINFRNHPDLRRVLMYDEFKGHPLRKDYPVQGKQPRVKLRSPEVANTARDMVRSELVKIQKRSAVK